MALPGPIARWDQFQRAFADPFFGVEQFLASCGVLTPPVPVYEIAMGMGILVYPVSRPPYDAQLEFLSDGQPAITYDYGHSYTRQRFDIAHELGHLMLHRPVTAVRRNTKFHEGIAWQEREANQFAADLLMPNAFMHAYWQYGIRDVYQLARTFEVSPAAMQIRMSNLFNV